MRSLAHPGESLVDRPDAVGPGAVLPLGPAVQAGAVEQLDVELDAHALGHLQQRGRHLAVVAEPGVAVPARVLEERIELGGRQSGPRRGRQQRQRAQVGGHLVAVGRLLGDRGDRPVERGVADVVDGGVGPRRVRDVAECLLARRLLVVGQLGDKRRPGRAADLLQLGRDDDVAGQRPALHLADVALAGVLDRRVVEQLGHRLDAVADGHLDLRRRRDVVVFAPVVDLDDAFVFVAGRLVDEAADLRLSPFRGEREEGDQFRVRRDLAA
nr:hypothetical protein [Halomicroarcula sp. SYNS111]